VTPPGSPARSRTARSRAEDVGVAVHLALASHHVRIDPGRQTRVWRSPHRYIWPSELDLIGQLAGFELEARHADWAGNEFSAESASHVSVYRLPAAS
jgi:hypothetical protein